MSEFLGYVFIIIAAIAGTGKGYCAKKVSGDVVTLNDAVNVNLLRSAMCFVIAAPFAFYTGVDEVFSIGISGLVICALSGISMAIFIISWVFAVKSGAYMLVSAFCAASFIVPYIFGIALFGDKLTAFKIVSVLLILVSLYFMEKYNIKLKGKIRFKDIAVLMTVLLSSGINQTTQKFYTVNFPDKNINIYTFYTFLFTSVVLLLAKPFFISGKNTGDAERHPVRNNIGYIAVMAVFLFANSVFMTLASKNVDSIVLYPVSNALSLAAGGVMTAICFGEKPNLDYVIGIIFVILGTVASTF